ncbi:MAG: hypothetical protein WCA35_05805 [Kovacikia sp.]
MARPDKIGDRSSAHYLAYTVSALCTAVLAFSVLRMLLPSLRVVVPVLVGWWLWRWFRTTQKNQQDNLNAVFYQLIQEHQGRITILDFSMSAKLPAIAAREFLDARAKEFSAYFEVTEQGDTFYVFRTLRSSPSQGIGQTQSLQETGLAKQTTTFSEPLTQAQLARRLGVSADAIRRKKRLPVLTEWSRTRDPEGISWVYLVQTQRFLPAERLECDRTLQSSQSSNED